ncbi:MAG: hypothetical protein WCK31_01295 [bacterium]
MAVEITPRHWPKVVMPDGERFQMIGGKADIEAAANRRIKAYTKVKEITKSNPDLINKYGRLSDTTDVEYTISSVISHCDDMAMKLDLTEVVCDLDISEGRILEAVQAMSKLLLEARKENSELIGYNEDWFKEKYDFLKKTKNGNDAEKIAGIVCDKGDVMFNNRDPKLKERWNELLRNAYGN